MLGFGQHVVLDSAGKTSQRLIELALKDPAPVTLLAWVEWSTVPIANVFADVPANLGYQLTAGAGSANFKHTDFQMKGIVPDANNISSFPANGFRWSGLAQHVYLDVAFAAGAVGRADLHAIAVLGTQDPPVYRVPLSRSPNPLAPGPVSAARAPYCVTRWRAVEVGAVPASILVYEPGGALLDTILAATLSDWRTFDARAFYFVTDSPSYVAGTRVTLEFM